MLSGRARRNGFIVAVGDAGTSGVQGRPYDPREWKKVRGRAGMASRATGMGNRGYPRSEDVLQARQPGPEEPVGAAPAPTHRLLFGHAPADEPIDHRLGLSGTPG